MIKNVSVRPRKHKHKEEMKKQEAVAQVHKTIKPETSFDEKNGVCIEQTNDNYSTNAPSREVSVDEESQINSKILSLIECEMKRDVNKHSHFTDSRPQSLSFYEDEKLPEELSGNLELLSPEEKKHYKKRREIDTDEMNVYNAIQDLYSGRDGDEIITTAKKIKSRKKRHGDGEVGIGDSREMMIPKERKKNKKKKRESSPSGKRKHKKKEEEFETKNDIAVTLEDLQDDVFENNDDFNSNVEKSKKSPKKCDKIYVQKKNKFEVVTESNTLNRQATCEEDALEKKFQAYHPLELALPFQEYWMRLTTLCHGLLGGLAFGHWLYMISNIYVQDKEFISHYSHFSDVYVSFFYLLCVICIVSVFEKIDFAHFERVQMKNLRQFKRTTLVVIIYLVCLIVHLLASKIDYKLGVVQYNSEIISNITSSELTQWNYLSFWRSILAFLAWIIVGLFPEDNMFYVNLKNMKKYLPPK